MDQLFTEGQHFDDIPMSFFSWMNLTFEWCSPGTPVSSVNKTDRHDIPEILLKVALNTINQPPILTGINCFIPKQCNYLKYIGSESLPGY
jgi:hypothetical protein